MTPEDLERSDVRSWVEGRCRHWAPPGVDARDLAQDVYVRLLTHDARALRACTATEEMQQRAYLLTVCDSIAMDQRRRRLTLRRGRHFVAVDVGVLEHMQSPDPTPEERLRASESLRERIGTLTAGRGISKSLRPILYGLAADLLQSEVAEALDLPLGTVYKLTHRLRRRHGS